MEAIKYTARSAPVATSPKHKIGIFRGAVKYLIRIIQRWILGQFTHQLLQFLEILTHYLLIHVARRNEAHYSTLSIASRSYCSEAKSSGKPSMLRTKIWLYQTS